MEGRRLLTLADLEWKFPLRKQRGRKRGSHDRTEDRKVYKHFYCECLAQTDLAILFDLERAGEEWIPKSVIDRTDWDAGDSGSLGIEVWFCNKYGY